MTFTFDPLGLTPEQVDALIRVGGVARKGTFTGDGQGVPEPRSVAPDLSRQLAKPVTGEDVGSRGPTYGPYHFSSAYSPGETLKRGGGMGTGTGGGAAGGTGGGVSGDLARALASERPASELWVRPAAAPAFAGPSLESIQELIARLAVGQELGRARGEDFNVSPGDGGAAGPPPGPPDISPLSPMLGATLEGAKGKQLDPVVRTLIDLIPLLTRVPIPFLGKMTDFVLERMTNPLTQATPTPSPRASSPTPTGESPGDGVPGAPSGAPPGATPATPGPDLGLALGGDPATPTAPGLTTGLSDAVAAALGSALGVDALGGPPAGEGVPGDTSGEGGLGEGSGASGPGGDAAWHKGGYVKRGPPRGPERRATLLEKEYVVKAKAVKLHRGLLEAINRGAPKGELRRLVEAGR